MAAELTIQEMQEAIMARGFVFRESTFPNGDVILWFKKPADTPADQHNPYAGCDAALYPSAGWRIGYGRYQRRAAWLMAYDKIVSLNYDGQ